MTQFKHSSPSLKETLVQAIWYFPIALLVAGCAVDSPEKSSNWPDLSPHEENLLSQQELEQLKADQAFDRENYSEARIGYINLARRGDKFAQYRIAVLHANGLGVERDLAQAFAWATLAAQLGQPGYVEYRERLAGKLDQQTREQAMDHLLKLTPTYGVTKTSARQMSKLTQRFRSCTGSRLGSTCASVQGVGSFRDADGNRYSNAFSFWHAVREQMAEMRALIESLDEQDDGEVILHDLELLEDEDDTEPE